MTDEMKARVNTIAEVLKSYGATEVYLFGSVAKGTNNEHSDIDIAVAGLPPEKFFEAMGDAIGAVKILFDLVDLDGNSSFVQYLKGSNELVRIL